MLYFLSYKSRRIAGLPSPHNSSSSRKTPNSRVFLQQLVDDMHPCKKKSYAHLPDDSLNLVYQRLTSSTDHSSFSLVCHRWLHIQNKNDHESLWDINNSEYYVTSQSNLFGSEVQYLCLSFCREYSYKNLSLILSLFPNLASVNLTHSRGYSCRLPITVKGLEVLGKSCLSLQTVGLGNCQGLTDYGLQVLAKWITDSGISSLVQNCHKIRSLTIEDCSSVTGLGFLGSPKTLTHVYAENVPKFTTEGIKAMVSGGGIQSLRLSGPAVTDEAVIAFSIGCPLLRLRWLDSCHEIQLEGWEAIGLYCRNLETLYVIRCPQICEQGLRALCYGCKKLSGLFVDNAFAKELFKRERPDVHFI
ncbi:hypothetical protein MKW94_013885 [Papaver nudicaule]|uniref:Uncharacterized protein n=1 Tax=Papaver nudicaule TaxID=74823 RepID=A0AA41W035_PAPNU|nr:hypothetical protein [Papaver nudicaule]MCL7050348.1 hypothetical protein [Papaver nudicaule]